MWQTLAEEYPSEFEEILCSVEGEGLEAERVEIDTLEGVYSHLIIENDHSYCSGDFELFV